MLCYHYYHFKYNRCVKLNKVSTRKKRQSTRRLLSQLNDFDYDVTIGNAMSDRQGNVAVYEGTLDQKFAAKGTSSNLTSDESFVITENWEKCFIERITGEMSKIVDVVGDRTQNAILTANPRSFVQGLNLERGEHKGHTSPFENVSEKNCTLHVLNTNMETRINIPDEVTGLSVPRTHLRSPSPRYTNSSHGDRKNSPTNQILEYLTPRDRPLHQIRIYQHKCRKTIIYQGFNIHQEI